MRPYLRCKYEREDKRQWSQTYVSKLTGISQSDISAIETGRWIPSANQLAKLSLAFGIAPTELLKPVPRIVADDYQEIREEPEIFLLTLLSAGAWIIKDAILEVAQERGITRNRLLQAKERLPVAAANKYGTWCWRLTEDA